MNEELAAYITHLCELSGHTTQIDDGRCQWVVAMSSLNASVGVR